jgi:hypothetical protein
MHDEERRAGTVKHEWRCTCGKLLGVVEKGRLQIRFARGHQYLVGFPASTVCRGCGSLNELGEGEKPKTTQA